ncbi:hypothetical protein LSM04_008152 [Trypanosoma melophagium]|uniref:uncharacterized protein n=1 Tax=Trypanosoma melophagium TaxID=715481 RepID=UPI00351AA959|nr:hypothetical protein LSM04_008152 [Trypanosoma melophagium]
MLSYAFQDKMHNKNPDQRIVLALLASNGTLSLLFILVAVYANHCLLARDDNRRRQREEEDRLSVGGDQTSQDGTITTLPSSLYNAAGILSFPSSSPIRDEARKFPNEVVSAGSKEIHPLSNLE